MIEQRTEGWYKARLGFLGCSRLGDVLAEGRNGTPSATRRNYMAELLCERLTGVQQKHFTTAEMQWGTDNEPLARSEYEARHGILVETTGGMEHKTIKGWWGSPDGLVGTDGGIEIKCLNTMNHLDVLFSKKIDIRYIYQITGYVIIFERDWYTYIGYDPRLPENVQYYEIRFNRDELPIELVTRGVIQFLDELNELVEKVIRYGVEPQEIKQEVRNGKSLW